MLKWLEGFLFHNLIVKMETTKMTISKEEMGEILKTTIVIDDRMFNLREMFYKVKTMKDMEWIAGEFAMDLDFVKFLFLEFAKI